jgi:hypothetical protein
VLERDGRPSGVQIITFTEKLTNLKYELLMAYFDRDIQFLNYVYSVTGVKGQRSNINDEYQRLMNGVSESRQ